MAITNLSNLPAIFDAVYAIAQGVPGITWAATYQGLWPKNADITSAPTLIVPFPEFAGFGIGGRLQGMTSVEASQTLDMFHSIDVYCVAPWDPNDANTWKIPMEALGLLVRAFRATLTLNATCFNSKLHDPHLVELVDKHTPGIRFFACQLTIQAWEQVLTPNT